MTPKYIKSRRIPSLFGHDAVTIGKYIFIKPEQINNPLLRRHEEIHVKQFSREPFLFHIKYLYYQIRYGYENNPYEIEAKQ